MKIKVLIISHTPMSQQENNGRTLRELFSDFETKNIAQLYLREGLPDADFCQNYYRITDFDIVNSILKFRKPGKIVTPQKHENIDVSHQKIYGKYSFKRPFIRFMRDMLWGINTWKTKELKNWFKEFSPDVIFFYASDSVFSQKLAYWVSEYLQKPMVIYWVDDYYIKHNKVKNIFDYINQKRYKKIVNINIAKSDNICLTNLMANDYEKIFKKKFNVLYTTSSLNPFPEKVSVSPFIISFLGNINIGRYESICTLGRLILENNLPFILNVYSGEKRDFVLEKILGKPGVNFMGEVPYADVLKIIRESDILLHVESFKEEYISFCKYSLSTKIADSLSSNRCLLAYGPREVASMQYLINNNCAFVATCEPELLQKLRKISDNPSILKKTAQNALLIAEQNHNHIINRKKLNTLLSDSITKHRNQYT